MVRQAIGTCGIIRSRGVRPEFSMRQHALAYPLSSTRMSDYLQLTKPRLNLLVVFTTGVGYWLGVAGHVDPTTLGDRQSSTSSTSRMWTR